MVWIGRVRRQPPDDKSTQRWNSVCEPSAFYKSGNNACFLLSLMLLLSLVIVVYISWHYRELWVINEMKMGIKNMAPSDRDDVTRADIPPHWWFKDLKTNRADVRENCFSTEVMIDRDDILKIWNPAELTILKSWQKTRADVEQKWHPRWRPTVSPRHWMNLADRGCAENADVIQPKPKEWRERMTKSASLKTRLGNPFFPNARKLNVSVGFAGPWSTCLLGSALLERKK